MIQRLQSLFLLAVALCLTATLFVPIWEKMDTENGSGVILEAFYSEIHTNDNNVTREILPTAALGILALVGIGVALFGIIKYRNRLTQMKLGALNSLVIAVFLGLAVYFTFRMEKMVSFEHEGTYGLGMYLPAIALIFNLLANRFIRKDEALVRSVDRIR